MFQVPQRPSAANNRLYGEVVDRWRTRRRPLQRPRVPRIMAGLLAVIIRPHHVVHKNQSAHRLKERPDANDKVPPIPPAPRLIRINPSRHPKEPRYMHEVEGQME